jgi:hypothetical protein
MTQTRHKLIIMVIAVLLFGDLAFGESINGFIRDDSSGEPLAFANVFLKDTDYGAISGLDGYFIIPNVPPGNYQFVVSFIGYEMIESELLLRPGENIRRDIRLKPAPLETEGITVTAERLKFEKAVEVSSLSISLREINVAPGFIEADVFRTLQSLPGIQSLNDFSSALYVRGSTPDQNLIMLDGIAVYNPYHLGGVFSTFNTDAIKAAEFSAGGFAAESGGRMGSILNIINREGNTEEFSGNANISLISSKLLLEGPIPKNKWLRGSWMLAGRRTYFDAVTNGLMYFAKKNAQKNDPYYRESDYIGFPYHFYDLEGKINLDFGDNHRLTYSSFYGDDIFHIETDEDYDSRSWDSNQDQYYVSRSSNLFDWRWGNKMNALAWRWIASPKLIVRSFLAQSRFRFRIDLDSDNHDYEYSRYDTSYWHSTYSLDIFDLVQDYTLKSDITWMPNNKHTVKSGFEQKWLHFNLGMIFKIGNTVENDFIVNRDTLLWMNNYPRESAVYIQDQWDPNPLLSMKPGLRLSHSSVGGKIYPEPRLGIKYRLTENVAVKASFGKYMQYLGIANPPDENLRFIDIWLAIPKEYEPSSATHSIIGIEYLSPKDLLLRTELYYKDFKHLLTLKPGDIFTESEGRIRLEPFNEFYDTDAFAYGAEFLLKKNTGKVQGWLGYTYAITKRRTKIENWYHPNYDRTHTINAVANWQFSEKLHISSSISYATGNPYTPILGQMQSLREDYYGVEYFGWYTNDRLLEGDKNSVRYPAYFRADIAFTNRKETRYGAREWYLQILNVSNHRNILTYIYRQKSDFYGGSGGAGIERFGIPMFPFLPTFGLKLEF